MKIDWTRDAKLIIKYIGGKSNIREIIHCATRLRFKVFNEDKVDLNSLKKLSIIKGYNLNHDQHQLIIGTGTVNKIYNEIIKILENDSIDNLKINKQTKIWNKELKISSNILLISKNWLSMFASIFLPLVPIFIVGGISLALVSLINSISKNSGIAKLLEIIGGAILGSLPAFVGYTAAKKMGGNPYLGLAMGLILIAPLLLNSYATSQPILLGFDISVSDDEIQKAVNEAFDNWKKSNPNWAELNIKINDIVGTYKTIFNGFFKIKLIGYQAQIIPVLLVLIISVNIEKLLQKITPDVLAIIVVPLVTVVFSSWLAFWIIGPLGQIIGRFIANSIALMFKYTNYTGIGIGGMIFAGIYPLLVITGLHQGFLPIEAQLLIDTKLQFGHSFSFITPIACVSNIAQGSAVLAWMIFTNNKQEKSKALSGSFGANLGITEPAMFGINLQIQPLLVGAIIGSSLGGYWLGMTHTVSNSLGSASWIGLVQFDWTTEHIQNYFKANNIHASFTNLPPAVNVIIAMSISMISTFIISLFLLKTKWAKKSINNYLKTL